MTYRELERLGDAELLRRTMSGKDEEFNWGWEILSARHREPLFGYIVSRVKSRADAEDVLQKTWIAAASNIGRYRFGQARFKTWLFGIARILILKLFEQRKAETGHCTRLEPDEEVPCDGQEAAFWQEVLDREIGKAVRMLPTRQKTILVLRYRGNRSFDRIAAILGRSKYWVYVEHSKAMARLRELVPNLAELRVRAAGRPVRLPY